jgi:leucyl-tRNA synthetase
LCADLKIASQNDKEKLAEAKEIAYTKGFYEGIMIVGDFAGQKVPDAKLLVKDLLVKQGLAMLYVTPFPHCIFVTLCTCTGSLRSRWSAEAAMNAWWL